MEQYKEVRITKDSIKTELHSYKEKPYACLFEYLWNSLDAGASNINIDYKISASGIGYIEGLRISDNGKGWKFDEDRNTDKFLSSTKSETNSKNKSLPRGKLGRGRFTFIWIAEGIDVYSGNKKISLNHDTKYFQKTLRKKIKGTRIEFIKPSNDLSRSLLATEEFKRQIIFEFGWLLMQNPALKIIVNGREINPKSNIKKKITFTKRDFSEDVIKNVGDVFKVEIVLWDEKPTEWSNFYFLDSLRSEIFKSSTGLNKKGDDFWHSVYITSDIFKDGDVENESVINQQFDFGDRKQKKLKNKIKNEIKEKLFSLRKPYLIEQSKQLISKLDQDRLLPNLHDFGVYDSKSFNELLRTVYIISPSLFTGRSNPEVKFICATFAGLLSTQDNHLIQMVLEQLQELTDDEKKDLVCVLEKTKLSNVISTIKEIDHRLEVIDKLKVLISDFEKETLEVKHIQKILDENFWLFGEQFRLFSTTEGALKNVLIKYAKEILEIDDPELESEPKGEVDLFLTKYEHNNNIQKNIIVELKRASVKLSRNKEFQQIENYKDKILEQSIANGVTQHWEFYLIGKDYDSGIEGYINNSSNHGENEKGLAFWDRNGRVKIYVRKWSDILETEWGSKMQYLKNKLEMKMSFPKATPLEITNELIKKG
ncbi:MAG: hypothetical protein ACD_5C00354G0004 [uncultured bacterium]|nr:MAG: hypothetical protein ACD_5C00354G0004 [uncultured bacterium]